MYYLDKPLKENNIILKQKRKGIAIPICLKLILIFIIFGHFLSNLKINKNNQNDSKENIADQNKYSLGNNKTNINQSSIDNSANVINNTYIVNDTGDYNNNSFPNNLNKSIITKNTIENNINETSTNKGENSNWIEYIVPIDENERCKDLDPINVFKNRLDSEPVILCKNEKSSHICYRNNNYELAVKNGVLCKMDNIILDPSKWQENGYTYKGPVDQNTKGEPLFLSGFFNMECNKSNSFNDYDKIYIRYFNSWNYQFNSNIGDDVEELAQGKTIFFMGRNQDSPNLFHGISEFINAFSLMILLNKEPKDIQIIFLESILLERVNDPLYNLYKNIISGGNEPIHIRDLAKKKYHISNGYFVPINWDSPCFLETSISLCKYPSKTYYLLNKYVDKYLNLSEFIDSSTDNETFYYPKKFDKSKQYKKYVTIQWRRVWPKGRKDQERILGNAPELAEKLASQLPDDILVRLIDTASLPIEEQISIMRKTDYFIGIHGAGLVLSIFLPKESILDEILSNMQGLSSMSRLSGHKTYTDYIKHNIKIIDDNENFFFDANDFVRTIKENMKLNDLIK